MIGAGMDDEMQFRAALVLLATALASGCASVSDVIPSGDGTYMVAAHGIDGNGSGATQKAIALQKANSFCEGSGAQIQVVHIETGEAMFGRPPSADLTFRCAKADGH